MDTADMCYKTTTHDFRGNEIKESDRYYSMCCWYDEANLVIGLERKETIAAWSLHRLIEMLPSFIDIGEHTYMFNMIQGKLFSYGSDIVGNAFLYGKGSVYDSAIYTIEWLIKEGQFNKEYLAE